MTDLSYSYIHMSDMRIASLDFGDDMDIIVAPESHELDIDEEHIPPDPDDADYLPSQVHLSYPYGNPTKLHHPASLGTYPFGRGAAHLYSQLSYNEGMPQLAGKKIYSRGPKLRWNELALGELLPIDAKQLQMEAAEQARRGATGAVNSATAVPAPTEGDVGPDGAQRTGETQDEGAGAGGVPADVTAETQSERDVEAAVAALMQDDSLSQSSDP